jgi:hypothetical protein
MLKCDEREFLTTFLGYHHRELIKVCTEKGCKAKAISQKINLHKTKENQFKAKPLTKKEFSTLQRFLYDIRSEYFTWCKSYGVSQHHVDDALKRMTQ